MHAHTIIDIFIFICCLFFAKNIVKDLQTELAVPSELLDDIIFFNDFC